MEDLYGDLLDDALIQPLEKDIEKKRHEDEQKLAAEKQLNDQLKKREEEFEALRKSYERLNTNSSYLMETAKTEVLRKDNKIKELQRALDDITFRRTKIPKKTRNVFTQTDEQRRPERSRDSSRDKKTRYRSRSKEKKSRSTSKERERGHRDNHWDKRHSRDVHPSEKSSRHKQESHSRTSRKRSRSRSQHRTNEKRRRQDEEKPRQDAKQHEEKPHHKDKKDGDLREKLRNINVLRTSPRKPKIEAPFKKSVEDSEMSQIEVLLVKSSDSEVEIIPEEPKTNGLTNAENQAVTIKEQVQEVKKVKTLPNLPETCEDSSLLNDLEKEISSAEKIHDEPKDDDQLKPSIELITEPPQHEFDGIKTPSPKKEHENKSESNKKTSSPKEELDSKSEPKPQSSEKVLVFENYSIIEELKVDEVNGQNDPHDLPQLNNSHDSSGASKENSLNKSQSKQKRTSFTKETVDEGVVIFTIARPTKNKKKKKTGKGELH